VLHALADADVRTQHEYPVIQERHFSVPTRIVLVPTLIETLVIAGTEKSQSPRFRLVPAVRSDSYYPQFQKIIQGGCPYPRTVFYDVRPDLLKNLKDKIKHETEGRRTGAGHCR